MGDSSMQNNETTEQSFDERIHDAYEQVSLSEDAEERILGELLRATAAKDDATASATPEQAEVLPMPSAARRLWLRVVLPVAACLLLAVIVGRGMLTPATLSAPDNAAKDSAQEFDVYEMDAAATASESSEGATQGSGQEFVIYLADGRAAKFMLDNGEPVEAEEALIGEAIGGGSVGGEDGAEEDLAAVYAIANDAHDEASSLVSDANCIIYLESRDTYYFGILSD